MTDNQGYLELAKNACLSAGEFLSKRQNITVDDASGRDIKLNSDKESEKIILDILLPAGIPVLCEERGLINAAPDTKLRWIVDPLDGTVNYFKGIDELCCISIALFDNGKPVLGVIYRYALKELYYGIACGDAYLNGKKIKPSKTKKIKDAVLATGFPNAFNFSGRGILQFVRQAQNFKKIRMLGSAALMAVFVASGRVDAYMETNIRLWDVAAAAAIINAAGALFDLDITDEKDAKCVFRAFATQELKDDYESAQPQ